MHTIQRLSIVLATALVLGASACGSDVNKSSSEQPAIAAASTTSMATTPAETTAAGTTVVTSTSAAATESSATYAATAFVRPFKITVSAWLPAAPTVDGRNFVTWESTAAGLAVRFLAPVNVYPPGGTGTISPPDDYLPYLLAQSEYGASFTDRTETTVGGLPATLVTATTLNSLDGSLGCQEEALAAPDCFGLQPDLTLRIAVIDAGDTTLLAWLRHDNAGTRDTTDEFASFEQMLATVRFLDLNEQTTQTTEIPVVTAIDGVWTTSFAYEVLADSPLLYDPGEANDENWGDWTLTFDQGRFTYAQKNPKRSSSGSGKFRVDGNTFILTLTNSEHFVMRWSVDGNELTFERDDALGISPTWFLLTPWLRQP